MPLAFTTPSNNGVLGALPDANGCNYRIWAPHAENLFLCGDFFHAGNLNPVVWDELPLQREIDANGSPTDYWSVYVPSARADSLYKYKIQRRPDGPASPLQDFWKHDPYARDAVSFDTNSVVVDRSSFDWTGDHFQMPGWNELIIYELHIGTFNKQGGKVGTFNEAIGKLDYLQDLGINAIEIMPAADFDTETSMGYNVALPFAMDNAYGRTDSLKAFIKAAHVRGIAVLMDVVYNHWGPEGLSDCLGRLDGYGEPGKQGIYFYQDYRSYTPYGDDNRPDYGRGEIRQFIRDNAMTLLEEFRIDGLRLDSTIAIRRAVGKLGTSGDIGDGWTLLRWLGEEKRRISPWKLLIAEDLQDDDSITRDTLSGGMGLDAQWAASFMGTLRRVLLAPNDESRLPTDLASAVLNASSGAGPFQRVLYDESHDQAISRRLTDMVAPGDAEGWLARKIAALGAGLVLTSPGIPMVFMGQEFLEWAPWSDNRNYAMDWARAGRIGGFVDLFRRLFHLRRNWDNNTRGLRGGFTNVFHADDGNGVLAFHRWEQGGRGDDVIVVVNLRNRTWPSYNLGFPGAGNWYLRFNSDWRGFCQDFSDVGYDTRAEGGPNQGMPFSGNVGLGPYGVAIYSQ